MNLEKTNLDTEEAREMLADILDALEETAQWCTQNAAEALSKLQDEWGRTCACAESTDTEPFQQECQTLLEDCAIFQNQVIAKTRYFTDIAQDRLPIIQELAGSDVAIQSLCREVAERWNDTEQPQLMFLYEKSEELEKIIRDLMAL